MNINEVINFLNLKSVNSKKINFYELNDNKLNGFNSLKKNNVYGHLNCGKLLIKKI